MRQILLLFSFVAITFGASAHEYFFAFAEVGYNEKESVLEATIISSAHETEDALNISGIIIKELEDHYKDAAMIEKLEVFLNDGFQINQNDKRINFKLIGFEVFNSGMVNFYLKSEVVVAPSSYEITFDLLMDQFPDQQNKVLFTTNSKTTTATFLQNKRTEIVKP